MSLLELFDKRAADHARAIEILENKIASETLDKTARLHVRNELIQRTIQLGECLSCRVLLLTSNRALQ